MVFVDILIAADRVAVTSLMIAAPLLCGSRSRWGHSPYRRLAVRGRRRSRVPLGSRLGSWRYWIPVGVVAMGSAFAVVTARYRGERDRACPPDAGPRRCRRNRSRRRTGEEIAAALIDVLVPRLVDLCAIDLSGPRAAQAIGGAATGVPDRARALLGRPAVGDETGDGPSGQAVRDETGDGPSGPAVRDETGDGPSGPAVRDETGDGPGLPAATEHRPLLDHAQSLSLGRDEEEQRLFERLKIESAVTVLLSPGVRGSARCCSAPAARAPGCPGPTTSNMRRLWPDGWPWRLTMRRCRPSCRPP